MWRDGSTRTASRKAAQHPGVQSRKRGGRMLLGDHGRRAAPSWARRQPHADGHALGHCEETMRCGNGTHLLAALPILPLLVTQDCATALFGADALALLERLAEGTRTDLAVLVETVGSSENLGSEMVCSGAAERHTRIRRATGS